MSEPAQTGVQTGIGRTIASWQLRAVVAVPVLVTVLSVVAAAAPSTWLVVALVAAATATIGNPRSHAATVLLALVIVATFGVDGPGWWLPLVVFGLHATHVGASLIATIPVAAEVELAALRPSLRRFVAVQAVAQAIVLAVIVLTL